MKALTTLCLAVAALSASGCRSDDIAGPIELRSPEEVAALAPAPLQARDLMDGFDVSSDGGRTIFLSAEEARQCPTIRLATSLGTKAIEVKPGARGYAEEGTITIVVFWSLDVVQSAVAVRHVSDLVRKYGRLGVRGLGVIEKTKNAAAAAWFAEKKALSLTIAYDDATALKKMRRQIDAKVATALPSIFIIDRQGRLRFFRSTFPSWIQQIKDDDGTLREKVVDSMPKPERVEDYLNLILAEQPQFR